MCINYDLKKRALPWLVVYEIVARNLTSSFFSRYLPSKFASSENSVIPKNALARKNFLPSSLRARKPLNEHPVITPQVISITLDFVFSASLLDVQHSRDIVKKPASLLVPWGKALSEIFPFCSGGQVAGNS